jgi:hypothetical protein
VGQLEQRWRDILVALRQYIPNPGSGLIPHDTARYNNSHTHAEVLAWLRRAIDAADDGKERRQRVINDPTKVPVGIEAPTRVCG